MIENYQFCPRCATLLIKRKMGDKLISACPKCHWKYFPDPKVGVGVMVIDDDKILLIKRIMNPERGKWSLPAGFVDAGEDPKRVAVREVWEETNLNIKVDGLIDVYHNSEEGGASIFILYRGILLDGDIRAGDDASEAQFFARGQLPELAFASTQAAIRAWG